ncbi:DNA polymerase IV [Halorussus rarus]|uniref:DNA polymerase IV n=1 Tax=Halorussus TaxID=1070314 RepID=UPI000E216AB3|nr:DNA polymerase IV [Halorussus sp. JP-T4]
MTGGGSRLPGTPDEDGGDPIVLHVDMDCFYAACERRREPELEGEPVVVGMGYEGGETHGAVATASYEAREYGVESAQAISTALERLPRMAEAEDPDSDVDPEEAGHYRPVDMDYYEEVSAEVKEILRESADVVREVSVDEAYLDVTDRTGWEVAEGFARHVRHRIDREVGVTASVGVAPNMSAAKIASDHDKPDGLVVIEPGEVREFLAPLDVAELHGVGPVTARELREMGIETAGDLAAADRAVLEERFGERGAELHRRARGEDDREVTPRGRPKSLSRESAFTEATDDDEAKREQVRTLAEAVADRARRKGALYRTIGIKAVTPPYDVNTRAKSLPGPVDDPDLVEEVALDLLEEFGGEAVRKVGVRVSNLSFAEGEQASLGDAWVAGQENPKSDSADSEAAESDVGATSDGAGGDGRDADGQRSLGDQWDGEAANDGDSSEEKVVETDRSGSGTGPDPDGDGQLSLEAEWDAAGANGDDSPSGGDVTESDEASESGDERDNSDDADPDGQVSLADF